LRKIIAITSKKYIVNWSKKNEVERENYLSSLNRYIEKQKEISKTKEEKAFKRYQSYVSIFIYILLYIIINI
jgi:intergrase/recombinase